VVLPRALLRVRADGDAPPTRGTISYRSLPWRRTSWITSGCRPSPPSPLIRPRQLTTKVPYAYAEVTGPGQCVFTASACPLDLDGNIVTVGDVAGKASSRFKPRDLSEAEQLTDNRTGAIRASVRRVSLSAWRAVPSGLAGRIRGRCGSGVRAPMEHRAGVAPRSVAVIMMTSGLHRAPDSASEHRSSTGTSTCDRQKILSIACVQVRGLLRVRRQGLEPRTRGLRARTRSYRPGSACASSCRSAGQQRVAGPSGAVQCRPGPRPPSTDRAPRPAVGAPSTDQVGERWSGQSSGLRVRGFRGHSDLERGPGADGGCGPRSGRTGTSGGATHSWRREDQCNRVTRRRAGREADGRRGSPHPTSRYRGLPGTTMSLGSFSLGTEGPSEGQALPIRLQSLRLTIRAHYPTVG
jgi:hypothetical protein